MTDIWKTTHALATGNTAVLKTAPDIFMAMIDTADIVAERYKLSREYQDEYSLESQRRMAAAQQANKFKDEIVPMKTKMKVVDKATKAESIVDQAALDRYTFIRDAWLQRRQSQVFDGNPPREKEEQ